MVNPGPFRALSRVKSMQTGLPEVSLPSFWTAVGLLGVVVKVNADLSTPDLNCAS